MTRGRDGRRTHGPLAQTAPTASTDPIHQLPRNVGAGVKGLPLAPISYGAGPPHPNGPVTATWLPWGIASKSWFTSLPKSSGHLVAQHIRCQGMTRMLQEQAVGCWALATMRRSNNIAV